MRNDPLRKPGESMARGANAGIKTGRRCLSQKINQPDLNFRVADRIQSVASIFVMSPPSISKRVVPVLPGCCGRVRLSERTESRLWSGPSELKMGRSDADRYAPPLRSSNVEIVNRKMRSRTLRPTTIAHAPWLSS